MHLASSGRLYPPLSETRKVIMALYSRYETARHARLNPDLSPMLVQWRRKVEDVQRARYVDKHSGKAEMSSRTDPASF